ncbi:MAG: type II toxin-antitoxin system RelB/DinJ family antitoxin [Bacteroidota bacterium]
MAKTAMINARIEPKLKKEVEGILQRLGLNTTQAVSLYFRHIKNYRGLPFEVKLPNTATRRAIEAARKGKVRRFHSASELAEELERS